jgi:hypothetical protein
MQTSATVALVVAGLLVTIGIIYLQSAYQEPIDAAKDAGGGDSTGTAAGGMDLATLLQTSFFTTAGLANFVVAGWILIRRNNSVRTPYLIAAGGSAALIILYITSRTVNIPIVGIQYDVGAKDILCKILQGAVIVLSIHAASALRKRASEIKTKVSP